MSMIADAFVSKLLDGLAALVNDEVSMLLGVPDEIDRLRETIQTMTAILADAERKKIQNEAINIWLMKLKDILYDADDIIDECRIEAQKSKAAASSGRQPCSSCCSPWTSVCGCFHLFSCSFFGKIASAHQIGRKIQDLNRELEHINKQKSEFDLHDEYRSTSQVSLKTSPIAEPDVVGSNIENDTDKLVELLIKVDAREDIPVYAIVGIGGIGKTTLARRIVNDERITTNFPVMLWVCVSKDFKETCLLKDVISQAGDNPGGDPSKAQLEKKVENALTNKKFLLVLDDLWDPKVWNDLLRNPLQRGATGSRVLVTTRNEAVPLRMKAVKPHHQVEALSAEDGWELLRKKVVRSGEEGEIEDLKDIGKDIVEKCSGLPLAIKTIGGLLSTKSRTERAWVKVLKDLLNSAESCTGLPDEVLPVLYLSYEDLPSHLKQCFLYCSLFPEDYVFSRRFLIHFWISEGFIHEEGSKTLEELGEDYYGNLVQMSFLQPHPLFGYNDPRCTVHDLLWSLCRFLARNENMVLKGRVEVQVNSPSVKPRRLQGYVTKENRQAFIDALKKHDSLRTLLLYLGGSHVEENDVNNLIEKTRHLRVLDFSGSKIVKLPDSLGNLIHLRYLALSSSLIREIPESIGNLVNLQFFILQACKNLCSLPKSIGKLHNLRSLDLIGTVLDGIPSDIEHLHLLNTLMYFVVRNSNSNSGWCTLKELRSLKKLEQLVIMKLERALNEGEVRVNALGDLLQLKVLQLSCTPGDYDDDEIKRIEEIFEKTLCPPPHLESLTIDGFFGLHYPSWIASYSLFSHLRQLHLGSNICPQLPPLGKLPKLEHLLIKCASAVKKIGTEFLDQGSRDRRCGMQIFPKLTNLIFEDMANWEEWEWKEEDDERVMALPKLRELTLSNCPKLMSLPSGLVHHATTLATLQISYCSSLKAIRGFFSIKEVKIYYSRNLEDVSDLPSLEILKLGDHEMQSLPEWFHGGQPNFPVLNKLEIMASDQQLHRCLKDGLDWPKIEHIRYVSAKNHDGSKYVSKSRSGFSTNLNDYVEDEKVDVREVLPSQ